MSGTDAICLESPRPRSPRPQSGQLGSARFEDRPQHHCGETNFGTRGYYWCGPGGAMVRVGSRASRMIPCARFAACRCGKNNAASNACHWTTCFRTWRPIGFGKRASCDGRSRRPGGSESISPLRAGTRGRASGGVSDPLIRRVGQATSKRGGSLTPPLAPAATLRASDSRHKNAA